MSADALLGQLKANEVAIEQKKAEIQSYIAEKDQVLDDISNLQNVIIPAQEKKVNEINKLVSKEYEAYNTRVSNAKTQLAKNQAYAQTLVDKAIVTRDSKKGTYNSDNSLYLTWKGHYDNGCKGWRGSFRGSYCGESHASCGHKNRKKHNYESMPPSYCLTKEVRNARNNYAKNKSIQYAGVKNSSYTDYQKAVTTYNNAVTNRTNQKNSTLVSDVIARKGPIQAQEKAYQDAKNILKNYIAPNGDKDRLAKKMDVIDNNISLKNTELQVLENERTVTEVAYQEKLNLINQQNAIIEEKEREAQAKRDQAEMITEGSIQNALNQNSGMSSGGFGSSTGTVTPYSTIPSLNLGGSNMGMGAPKQASMSNVLIIGLLLVGGGYLFMKSKK
jgi:hypothetical protein